MGVESHGDINGVDGINDEVDAGSNGSETLLLCNEVQWSAVRGVTDDNRHAPTFYAAILWSDNVDPKTRMVSDLFGISFPS